MQDIGRPDVNGVPPKMAAIGKAVEEAIAGLLPWSKVQTNDNLMSSVSISGTLEPKDQWMNGIFHNANNFIASITPAGGKRYYDPADPKITVEVSIQSRKFPNFRKYTAPPDKVIAKLKSWIESWNKG